MQNKLVEARKKKNSNDHRKRDHGSLPLTGVLQDSFGSRQLTRMKDLIQNGLRVDFCPGARIGAAIRTEARRVIDRMVARDADCFTHLRGTLYRLRRALSRDCRSASPV